MSSPSTIAIVRHDDIAAAITPRDTGGRVVYAIGDVHGRYDLLLPLLEAIAADARTLDSAGAAGAAPMLVFVGDYVDRGPDSAKVLSTLVWLSRHSPFDPVFLRGNHEAMMLDFVERPHWARSWLRVGGAEALAAYEVEPPADEPDEVEATRLRDELMDRLPASHLAFLRNLPTRFVQGDYVFVHAGLRPGVSLARQEERDLLWIRGEFLDSDRSFGRMVVHGHSWDGDLPVVTPHRIGIDTGAYRTGALTAVRLGTPAAAVIQAVAPMVTQ